MERGIFRTCFLILSKAGELRGGRSYKFERFFKGLDSREVEPRKLRRKISDFERVLINERKSGDD